jgi:hypothetical protein
MRDKLLLYLTISCQFVSKDIHVTKEMSEEKFIVTHSKLLFVYFYSFRIYFGSV